MRLPVPLGARRFRAERAHWSIRVPGAAHDVGAGLVTALLALVFCFSYATLIFAGPLLPRDNQGEAPRQSG